MPQIIRDIDDIVAERNEPVLLLRFGDLETLMSGTIRRKREDTLARLDREGYAWEACGPPKGSGWLSYLGDVALTQAYSPGELRYEQLRTMFEDDAGEALDRDVALCLFAPRSPQ